MMAAEIAFESADGVEQETLTVAEDSYATFAVRLTEEPPGDVALTASRVSGESDISIVRGASLVFTPDNWRQFQPIVVRAASDDDATDGAASIAIGGPQVATRLFVVAEIDDDLSGRKQITHLLVDDFLAKPLLSEQQQGQEFSYFNRLGGDRGEVAAAGRGEVNWHDGSVEAKVLANGEFAGVFTSLQQNLVEGRSLNLHAMLPGQIASDWQMRATALVFEIDDGQGEFQIELKTAGNAIRHMQSTPLAPGRQTLRFPLPSTGLEDIQTLVWLVRGNAGDHVQVSRVAIEAESAPWGRLRHFLAVYAPLLANLDEETGRTRDRAEFPAGAFDNTSASGLQALAGVSAWRLGVVSEQDARWIVEKTTSGLLAVPHWHGVLPHFTRGTSNPQIAPGSEYSSLDTIIAWLSLRLARIALGMSADPIDQALRRIDWYGPSGLILPNGTISHGYSPDGTRLEYGWDTFGGESFLAMLGFAMSQPSSAMPSLPFHSPPTANGAGFNDELAWLFAPAPERDAWGNDWSEFGRMAAEAQINDPIYAAAAAPLFGSSAAEHAEPWAVPEDAIYQAFGLGGRFAPRNDGVQFVGHPIAAPHYAAMIAARAPQPAEIMLDFLWQRGLLTPLNAVESVYGTHGEALTLHWNSLKGSWNLGLAALGLARRLTGDADYPAYVAARSDASMQQALERLSQPASDAFPFVISGGRFWRDGAPTFLRMVGYSPLTPGQNVFDEISEARLRDDLRRLRQFDSDNGPLAVRLYPQPTAQRPLRFPQYFFDELRANDIWLVRDIYFDGDYQAPGAVERGKAAIDAVIAETEAAGGLDRVFAFEWGNEFLAPLPEARTPQEAAQLKSFLNAMRDHLKSQMALPGREKFSDWFTWGSLPSYDPLFSDADGSIPVTLETADFLSFNTYSYFPEALRHHQAGTVTGTPFAGYLEALRESLPANLPIVISETGLPGSPTPGEGQSRLPAWGPVYRYGGLSDEQIAEGLAQRFYDARLSGAAAGIAFFQFADEWWKAGAASQHDDHPEEHFGLARYRQRLGEFELRNKLQWNEVRELLGLRFITDQSLRLAADDLSLAPGAHTTVRLENLAASPQAFTYRWEASRGRIVGDDEEVLFIAPEVALGPVDITAVAIDAAGTARTTTLRIDIAAQGPPAIELLTSGPGRASGRLRNVDLSRYEAALYVQTDKLYQQPFLPSADNPEMTRIWVDSEGYFATPVHNSNVGGQWGELVAFVLPRGADAENTPPIGYSPEGAVAAARLTAVNDLDNDLLPDGWENAWLGAVSFDGLHDNDNDVSPNLEEFRRGGNPAAADNDSDGDGLADNWERRFLATLDFGRSDDLDGDGLANSEEYARAIDPTRDAADGDDDGLPDRWEQRYYGGLAADPATVLAPSGLTNRDAYELSIAPVSPFAWRNERMYADVNDDRRITNADALLVVGELRAKDPYRAFVPLNGRPPYFFDASGDDYISQLDALIVVSAVRASSQRVASLESRTAGQPGGAEDHTIVVDLLHQQEASQEPMERRPTGKPDRVGGQSWDDDDRRSFRRRTAAGGANPAGFNPLPAASRKA